MIDPLLVISLWTNVTLVTCTCNRINNDWINIIYEKAIDRWCDVCHISQMKSKTTKTKITKYQMSKLNDEREALCWRVEQMMKLEVGGIGEAVKLVDKAIVVLDDVIDRHEVIQ